MGLETQPTTPSWDQPALTLPKSELTDQDQSSIWSRIFQVLDDSAQITKPTLAHREKTQPHNSNTATTEISTKPIDLNT